MNNNIDTFTCPLAEDTRSIHGYRKGQARWCPGCGDHSVLSAFQRFLRDQQVSPEQIVVVSGIGCSGRFPHYVNTYGFHGLHGRAFPVACGVKFRRPDLHVVVVTGDGDCCSIGAGHWLHAVRYNMDMTVLLLDNHIYSMTKKQTSPTSPLGTATGTHPGGAVVPPVNPVETALGMPNVSFVAQTVDWAPAHLSATIAAAWEHPGFSFVRVVTRCPHFLGEEAKSMIRDREHLVLLTHEKGIQPGEKGEQYFRNRRSHHPGDLQAARQLASEQNEHLFVGLFYQNQGASRYDLYGMSAADKSIQEKREAIERQFDAFAI